MVIQGSRMFRTLSSGLPLHAEGAELRERLQQAPDQALPDQATSDQQQQQQQQGGPAGPVVDWGQAWDAAQGTGHDSLSASLQWRRDSASEQVPDQAAPHALPPSGSPDAASAGAPVVSQVRCHPTALLLTVTLHNSFCSYLGTCPADLARLLY